MKYFVTIAGQEIEVVVAGGRVTVDGEPFEAHLGPVPGTPVRHLLLGLRSYTIPMESWGGGHWSVSFHGDRHEVVVVDERTRYIRSLTAAAGVRVGGGVLRAPMPGLVVRVQVEPGQSVVAGTGVVVLEAMKMENELRASGPATVKAVLVKPGQAVDKGAPLIEFD